MNTFYEHHKSTDIERQTRLGFAVLLKFFQLEAYFRNKHRTYLR
jgi:hypothetical protein